MSGVEKRRTEDVDDTAKRSDNATAMNSDVNWHLPGGTSALVGGPVRLDGSTAVADDIVEAARTCIAIVLASIYFGMCYQVGVPGEMEKKLK